MIKDNLSNFVWLSDLLPERSKFYPNFIQILEKYSVAYGLIPNTKDIWSVDYMPIQIKINKFVQFVYEPDYLQNKNYIASQTNSNTICNEIGINTIKSTIKLDGGNVIKGDSWVIFTDKIFRENKHIKSQNLLKELENLFEAKPIIIPQEPNDWLGHADGCLRYYNPNTVLINSYQKCDRTYASKLKQTLKNESLNFIEIPYNPYQNKTFDSATGYYINFLQTKDLIILPAFHLNEDDLVHKQFQDLFPTSIIKSLDCRDISKDGGVLNCISWNILKAE